MKRVSILGGSFSTLLCEQCSNDLRRWIEERWTHDSYFDASVELQTRDFYLVYVLHIRAGDFSRPAKFLLCGDCCRNTGRMLKDSGASLSQIKLRVERYGPIDDPLILISIPRSHNFNPVAPKKPASRSNQLTDGLWWHSSN